MNNFDLFTLLIELEQDWLKRKTAADHLVALAGYINRTMRSLEEACQANGLALAPDTLATLLAREQLTSIGDYQLRIAHNTIELDEFSAMCRSRLDGGGRATSDAGRQFYQQARTLLEQALAAAFHAINARIASPIERAQNQEAWEALFLTFAASNSGGA